MGGGQLLRPSVLQSNLQLVSGILYVALFFVGAAASSVLAASVEFADGEVDPDVARQFPVFGSTVVFVFAFRMAAMFVFTTSSIGLRAAILPRWFAWSGYAVATFLLLSASFQRWFVLVFPVWLLASACCCSGARARSIRNCTYRRAGRATLSSHNPGSGARSPDRPSGRVAAAAPPPADRVAAATRIATTVTR